MVLFWKEDKEYELRSHFATREHTPMQWENRTIAWVLAVLFERLAVRSMRRRAGPTRRRLAVGRSLAEWHEHPEVEQHAKREREKSDEEKHYTRFLRRSVIVRTSIFSIFSWINEEKSWLTELLWKAWGLCSQAASARLSICFSILLSKYRRRSRSVPVQREEDLQLFFTFELMNSSMDALSMIAEIGLNCFLLKRENNKLLDRFVFGNQRDANGDFARLTCRVA